MSGTTAAPLEFQELTQEQAVLMGQARSFLGYLTRKWNDSPEEDGNFQKLTEKFFDRRMNEAQKMAEQSGLPTDPESVKRLMADRLLEGLGYLKTNQKYEMPDSTQDKLRALITGSQDTADFVKKMVVVKKEMGQKDSLYQLLMANDANGNAPNYSVGSGAGLSLMNAFEKAGMGGFLGGLSKFFGVGTPTDPNANPEYVKQNAAEMSVFEQGWRLSSGGEELAYAQLHMGGKHADGRGIDNSELNRFEAPSANPEIINQFYRGEGGYSKPYTLLNSGASGPEFQDRSFRSMILNKWESDGVVKFTTEDARQAFINKAAELATSGSASKYAQGLLELAESREDIVMKSEAIDKKLERGVPGRGTILRTDTNEKAFDPVAPRIDAAGIVYGPALQVDGNKSSEVAFKSGMSAYKMEEDGKLTALNDEIKGGAALRDFLGGDYAIRVVKVGGNAQGYFAHKEGEDGQGVYLGVDAIDLEEMDESLKACLSTSPAASPASGPVIPGLTPTTCGR